MKVNKLSKPERTFIFNKALNLLKMPSNPPGHTLILLILSIINSDCSMSRLSGRTSYPLQIGVFLFLEASCFLIYLKSICKSSSFSGILNSCLISIGIISSISILIILSSSIIFLRDYFKYCN
jgi:hypothetical protein